MAGAALTPCPRCGAPLPELHAPSATCPACGARFGVRALRVRRLDVRKVAGVRRQLFRLEAEGEPEPLAFEGPQGLAAGAGDAITLLYQEGRPLVALVAGGSHPLAPAPSEDADVEPRGRMGGIAGGIVWAAAVALLLLAAAWIGRAP